MKNFKTNKTIDRLNQMIDNAINGNPIENTFDETKVSALETKLNHYLAITQTNRRQLEEEKWRINHLISDISHQTKTPLANILLYSQLLSESELCQEDSLCVNALIAQTEKLNFLISSLIKSSRLEAGVISVSPAVQHVQPLLDSIVEQIQARALKKEIQVTCLQTQLSAVFDSKWTAEALFNILDNAVKYTPSGGSVTITTISYPLFCRIDISDTGIGICEEDTPKIFSRFYRSSAVNKAEGIGIGLYLAREIITKENGYIKVSSQLGSGSTFSIFLPMKN